jgi:hypothetical protein
MTEEEKSPVPLRVNLNKYGQFVSRREVGKNKLTLSSADKEAFQSELLITFTDIEKIKEELATISKKAKAKIAELTQKQNRARSALDLGYEEVEGERLTIIFIEERRAGIYDSEGRLLTHRPLSQTEMQTDLYVESSLMDSRRLASSEARKVTIESIPDPYVNDSHRNIKDVDPAEDDMDNDEIEGLEEKAPKHVTTDPFA